MQDKRLGHTRVYGLASVVSSLLALLSIVVAVRFYSLPQDRSALTGLCFFFSIMAGDLCLLYFAWSLRSEKEGGAAARWRAGLAVGSLLIALAAGVLLQSLGPLLWKAFLSSLPLVLSAFALVSQWLEEKSPESRARASRDPMTWWLYITNGLLVLLFFFSLGLEVLPESSGAVLGSLVLALSATVPLMIYASRLRQAH